jgi:hypothetical protein
MNTQMPSRLDIARIDLKDARATIVAQTWEFRELLTNIIQVIDAAGNDPQKLDYALQGGFVEERTNSHGIFSYDLSRILSAGELMASASQDLEDAGELEGALQPWVNNWKMTIRPDCPSCHGTDFVDGMCCVACQVATAEAQDAAERQHNECADEAGSQWYRDVWQRVCETTPSRAADGWFTEAELQSLDRLPLCASPTDAAASLAE